jgi:hypothetical protein
MTDRADRFDDPRVPAVRLLLGPDHVGLVEEMAAASGASVRSARIGQVRYVPGRSITAQYEVELVGPEGVARATFVAMAGIEVPEPRAVVSGDGVDVVVWRYPNDPFLPGLASAADIDAARALLRDLGAPSDRLRIRRRAYRAGRRAVLQLIGSDGTIYLKIIRPGRVAALQSLHKAMAGSLPVPESLGWSEAAGVVALQALPGRPLREVIESGAGPFPDARMLLDLLDRVPATDAAPSPGPATRVAEHARLIGAVAPELGDRLGALDAAMAAVPAEPIRPIHGDFHSSQVLVDGSRVTGLVDIDTAGLGARSDDLAGFLAHLSVLALGSARRGAFERYGASLIRTFDRVVDPVGLRLRVAASIVGFATGPFRVQLDDWSRATEDRIALAERWLDAAGR